VHRSRLPTWPTHTTSTPHNAGNNYANNYYTVTQPATGADNQQQNSITYTN